VEHMDLNVCCPKKMVPLVILITAHQMLVFALRNGTLWFNLEFSVDHYLLSESSHIDRDETKFHC
jgi:hypothetical protein